MNDNEMVLGIDIGGTTTTFGFVDRSGKRLATGVIPTEAQQPAEILVARLQAEIAALQATLPHHLQLKGIGIGAPNANYRQGTVENPP